MNFDLNRLARSTSAGSVQGLSGRDARDIPAAVARLLAHSRAERIITCSPADYLAFKALFGARDALHHGVPALNEIETDVLIIGASLAGAAAAKRTVDAGFHTIILERKTLPRHKICSGILSPRGYSFLRENFGEPPDNAFHAPKWVTGVNFLFPSGLQLPMPFIPGPTPHIYRKHADHHVVKASRAEVHERTEFRDIETGAERRRREGAPRRARTARRSSIARST